MSTDRTDDAFGRLALWARLALTISLVIPNVAFSQSDLDRARNLVRCLEGRVPTLCNRQWLSPTELAKAQQAERDVNLRRCSTGRTPTLCRHDWLGQGDAATVSEAERTHNLRICSSGNTPSLCRKAMLAPAERQTTEAAEKMVRDRRQERQPPQRFVPDNRSKAPATNYSSGCGSRGGPGWRKPNGKCASWRD